MPFPTYVNNCVPAPPRSPTLGPCLSVAYVLSPVDRIESSDKSHLKRKGLFRLTVQDTVCHGRKSSPEVVILSSFHCLYSPGSSQAPAPPTMGESSGFNSCKTNLPQAHPQNYLTNLTFALAITGIFHLDYFNGTLNRLL